MYVGRFSGLLQSIYCICTWSKKLRVKLLDLPQAVYRSASVTLTLSKVYTHVAQNQLIQGWYSREQSRPNSVTSIHCAAHGKLSSTSIIQPGTVADLHLTVTK